MTSTHRLNPRPKMFAARQPMGNRVVEQGLRDIAFVLKMTQRIKHAILSGEPLPGSTGR